MSAPHQGRQSPSPQNQTDEQQAPLASGKTPAQFRQESMDKAQRGAQGLESNPKHPLEDIEARKFSKGPGNKSSQLYDE
ncbi:hypothetical protein FE257_011176 [Aspergillus nanangensis]|uniref:Uncharacterized protein n=1 Tax=Aspergillus nanangensis TaxID=2582783 RepID=A0AAD4GSR2_ASPNN|nr:hypothetical protein FE257_011176 [Aspergillus nanangensis]